MVRVKRKPPHSNNHHGLVRLMGVVVGASIVVAFVISSGLEPSSSSSSSSSSQGIAQQPQAALEEFPHEFLFRSTLRSCRSDQGSKCKEYIAPGESSRERVAFLTPPGDVSNHVLKVIQFIAQLYNTQQNGSSSLRRPQMEVIGSTHVPPYGYGKTHGYTKIIRLVPHPLISDVADAMLSLKDAMGGPLHPTMDDVRTVVRQILRFHCRLSHVAAHTALLTLDVVEQTPQQLIQDLVNFIVRDQDLDRISLDHVVMHLVNSFPSKIRQVQDRARDLASKLHDSAEFYQDLDLVLLEEIHFTKNMTVWPCPSFWSAADGNSLLTSSITQTLARALSPNCSDPMASCFVKRDKCEAAGDALCQDKKR